jgi:hypothetical protein
LSAAAPGDAWLRRLAWVVWGLSLALVAGEAALLSRTYFTPIELSWGFRGFGLPIPLTFATVGILIAARWPRHRIGWLFLASGFGFAVQGLAEEYAIFALQAYPGLAPGGELAAWIDNWSWIPSAGAAVAVLVLFPDGRLLSPRWRLAAACLLGGAAGTTILYLWQSGPMRSSLPIDNPFAIDAPWVGAVGVAGFVALAVGLVLALAAVVWRLRRAGGVEREQMKWLFYAASLLPLVVGVGLLAQLPAFSAVPGVALASQIVTLAALLAIPIAMGIAILRHRLYDIDVLINRTLVYGLLTVLLALAYLGSVVVFQAVFRAFSGERSQLAVVGSTLAIAALFSPLRRRVQDFIDRRFYRRKYDAAQALAEFAAAARDETDLDTLAARLVGVVDETVQPKSVSLWLRPAAGR